MYRYLSLLLLTVWGLSSCCLSSGIDYGSRNEIGEDSMLLEAINEHLYPDLVRRIRSLRGSESLMGGCELHVIQFLNKSSPETLTSYFDSMGKPGPGILLGNVVYLGYYDQCIDIGDTDYCRFPFNVSVTSQTATGNSLSASIPVEFGLCFPSSCNPVHFYHLITGDNEVIYNISRPVGDDNITVTVQSVNHDPICPWRNLKWTPSSIVVLTICVLFVLLVIIGTGADVLLWVVDDVLPKIKGSGCAEMKRPVSMIDSTSCEERDTADEKEPLVNRDFQSNKRKRSNFERRMIEFFKDLILSFSLYKTIPTIMATHQPANAVTSINGIRVISMFWVILGHTFLWGLAYGVTANVKEAVETIPKRFSFQPIANSFLSVDSFFVMSGLLLSYLAIREMDRRNGKFPFVFFYVHRILRLSPAYYFVIFINFKILPYIGSGPLWQLADVERCGKYWWTNILYINNFYPTTFSDQCFGVTWYLANDMQFFIISPIFLLLLYHFWIAGIAAIAGTMIGSIVIIGTLAGIKNPNANLLQGTLVADSSASLSDFAYSNIYEKPYCRINAYLVGVLLGFIFYKKLKVPRNFWVRLVTYATVWAVAAVFCVTIAYGQYQTWNGDPFNKAQNVMFFMFNRTIWSIGIALMIYACHNGFGGAINTILSWSVWVPLSRLTFMAYLAHPMVLSVMYSTMRFRFIYTDIFLSVLVVAAVVLAFSVALVFAAVVEYPLANVEAAIYKFAGVKRRK